MHTHTLVKDLPERELDFGDIWDPKSFDALISHRNAIPEQKSQNPQEIHFLTTNSHVTLKRHFSREKHILSDKTYFVGLLLETLQKPIQF